MGTKISCILIFLAFACSAQNLEEGEREGLIRATASFYHANSLNSPIVHYYIGGNTEYFFDDRYALRGDIYSLIGEKYDTDQTMRGTAQLSVGFNRHFTKKRLTVFVGAFTGVSQLHMRSLLQTFAPDLSHPPVQYVPLTGLMVGVQYYFYTYFHFFTEARFTHMLHPFEVGKMDELSVSAGLAFQFPLRKSK